MSKQESAKQAIASRLRIAREYSGLSQSQVAKMLGLHRPAISEVEAGRRKISAEELLTLSQIYNVSINWLAGNELQDKDENYVRVELAARELAKLKPDDLDRLLKLLRSLRTDPG